MCGICVLPPSLPLSSEVTASQPVVSSHHEQTDGAGGLSEGEVGEGGVGGNGVAVESFTQPVRNDELIIGTQIPCTPGASQVHTATCTAHILCTVVIYTY